MHNYGRAFYSYNAPIALHSARVVIGVLNGSFRIRSVADFGCGEGPWLSAWKEAGAAVMGVDGPYVDRCRLWIDPAEFRAADLSGPIDLGRRFDLVQSLEVAEHLSADKAEPFVATLVAHGSFVMFSAAVPGQGGEHHVNERPLEHWRAMFRQRGYVAVDYLRPLIFGNRHVAWWYRFNILLYVRRDLAPALPEAVRAAVLPDGEEVRDYHPRRYRFRNAIVRRLPAGTVDRLASVKARMAARRAGLRYPA